MRQLEISPIGGTDTVVWDAKGQVSDITFCVYCYANTSKEDVLRNKDKKNDTSETLLRI